MIDLYTAQTPNGWKVSIMLEELGVKYNVKPLRLDQGQQKEPSYLEINPNGRIPAIVDHDNGGFAVFESGAILVYLAEKYGKFLPKDDKGRSKVIQWLMFQMSGLGPMMGQAYYFMNLATEKVPFAVKRYQDESKRTLSVLDVRLKSADFLADEYSIADIATYPWVGGYEKIGLSLDFYPSVQRWFKKIGGRPAVGRGMSVPSDADYK
jgi:GST-like protein